MAHPRDKNWAQVELTPLASATGLLPRTQNTGYDGGRSSSETPSLISRGNHDQDRNETSTNPTGLLIRDTTLPQAVDSSKGVYRNGQSSNAFATWSLELASLLLAFGLMGAMIAILQTFSDAEMPKWNGNSSGGITLNALIGLLATIFRATLAFVAFEVLAELKWEWVAAGFRPLRDVQRFEDASRGAWGSIMLLPVVALRQPLTLIAVVVVVLSVAVGPFTQQAMQTYYCLRDVDERPADVQVAHRIEMESSLFYTQRATYHALHVGLQSAMQDSMVNPSNSSNIESIFDCPTGNCTFSTYADRAAQPDEERASYASLGMCSRCEDVYELARTDLEDGEVFVRLPVSRMNRNLGSATDELQVSPGNPAGRNTSYLDATVISNLTWASRVVPQDFLNVASWSAANFSILALSQDRCSTLPGGNISCPLVTAHPNETDTKAWDEPTDYIAAACTLYPCIKYYASRVQNGALTEKVVRSTPLRHDIPVNGVSKNWLYGIQTPCWVNGTLYTSSNMSSASEKLPDSVKQYVPVDLRYWPHDGPDTPVGDANMTAPRDCVMSTYEPFLDAIQVELMNTFGAFCRPQGHQTQIVTCINKEGGTSIPMAGLMRSRFTSLDTIRENIDSLSMRMTTEIRHAGWGPYTKEQVVVKGEASENRTCLHVAWAWFALPAALLGLCTLLLAGIIVRDLRASNDGVVWKSSVLPFLLKDHVPGLESSSLKKLDVVAKEFEIKLQKAD